MGGKINSEEFLTIYNDLDKYMRRILNVDDWVSHTELIKRMACKNKVFLKYKENLIEFAKLRNAIVHNPDKKYAEPIAEPHDFILNKYRDINNKVQNPPLALDTIAIKSGNIYTTNMDAIAFDVMKEMNKKAYTHVPVVESGKVIGIFSENTIFSYMVTKGDVLLEKEAKIEEFSEFIPIDKKKVSLFNLFQRIN